MAENEKQVWVKMLRAAVLDTEKEGLKGMHYQVPPKTANYLLSIGAAELADGPGGTDEALEEAKAAGLVQNRDPRVKR